MEDMYLSKKLLFILFFLVGLGSLALIPSDASAAYVSNNKVYTYEIMEQDIKELAKAYPDLIKYQVIGKSEYGRNIYAVSLGNGPSVVQINGSHHAREWMTTMVNMNMLEQYAQAYKNGKSIDGFNVKSIINQSTIWFIPMVNPDGVTLQQFGLKKFPSSDHKALIKANDGSMDFRRWKANGKGIDLNRQYDADWENICCNPGRPYFKNYKGPRQNYAKETIAMVDFINKTKPEIVVSYHSSGEILYWNFHQSGSRYNRDHSLAKQIGKMTGYSLIYPKANPSGGGLTDWFISHYKRPAFTVEIAPYVGETSIPLSYFPSIWNENKVIGLYTANEGYKLYMKKYSPVKSAATKKVNDAFLTSKSLRSYHTNKIKRMSDVTVSTSFMNIYNKTGSLITTAERSLSGLTSSDRAFLTTYIKEAKERKLEAARFIDAVKVGDKLSVEKKGFDNLVKKGILNASVVKEYDDLSYQIKKSEQVISRVYGGTYRNLFGEKYIVPAKISKEAVIYEISRYKLLTEIETDIANKDYKQAGDKLAMLGRLEKRSIQIKADGNKLHPGKYPDLPGIETQLVSLKEKLVALYEEAAGITNLKAVNETITKVQQLYTNYQLIAELSEDLPLFKELHEIDAFIEEAAIKPDLLNEVTKAKYNTAIVQLQEVRKFEESVLLGEELLKLASEMDKLEELGQPHEEQTFQYNSKKAQLEELISEIVVQSQKTILVEKYM